MSDDFSIDPLSLGAGALGLCALPGRGGAVDADLAQIIDFSPALVLSLAPAEELAADGVSDLRERLSEVGIGWRHFPIKDFDIPAPEAEAQWNLIASEIHDTLDTGGRVVIHCKAGRGRTGAAALRLMIEAGEAPEEALVRLRTARPGSVETPEQERWAKSGTGTRTAP
jgi:protein-tyrosine phosphatase